MKSREFLREIWWGRWRWTGPLAVGALVRGLYATQVYCSTFDTATVGLMAMRILQDGERPWFFYGQRYFGSLEAWLAAGLFWIFGISEEILTLAAILPSLAWIWLTGRLFETWQGRAAGLAAAWSLALPGWIVLHYCVGTYGGYPIAFALGTFVLWKSMQIHDLRPRGQALLVTAVLVAAAAGLAIWTHLISLAYLAPAAVLIAWAMVRDRCRWPVVWPWLVAMPVLSVGLLPYLALTDVLPSSDHSGSVLLSPSFWWHNFKGLAQRPLRQQFLYDRMLPCAEYVAPALLAVFAVVGVAKVREEPSRAARGRWRWALWFCGLFLVQYLPHRLAATRAPRYVIPLWTMALATALAAASTVRTRPWKWIGRGAWALWFAHVGVHTALQIHAERPSRHRILDQRRAVVEAARAAGVRTVTMLTSDVVAHRGQAYTFAALGRPVFVNPYTERHQPSAVAAERDDAGGFLVQLEHAVRVRETLRHLGASWSEISAGGSVLIFDVQVAPVRGRSVLPDRLRVRTGDGRWTLAVTDRSLDTAWDSSRDPNRVLEVHVDPPANLLGLHLLGPAWPTDVRWPHVARCELVGPDGSTVLVTHGTHRIAPAWTAGPRVYMLGYGGHIELRWPQPVTTACVRLEFEPVPEASDRLHGCVSELFLREVDDLDDDVSSWHEAVPKLVELVERWQLEFLVSDRWLAARLNEEAERRGAMWRAFPRFNPRFRSAWPTRRLAPARGLAIVVPAVWSEEVVHVLRRCCPRTRCEITRVGPWVVCRFPDSPLGTGLCADGPLEWSGTFLLQASSLDPSGASQPVQSKMSSH